MRGKRADNEAVSDVSEDESAEATVCGGAGAAQKLARLGASAGDARPLCRGA